MKQNEKDIRTKGPKHHELECEQCRNSTQHSGRGWQGKNQRLSGVRKTYEEAGLNSMSEVGRDLAWSCGRLAQHGQMKLVKGKKKSLQG